jgi:hypothetical protein
MRRAIPRGLRDFLLLEAGVRCPVPKCEREVALDVHHIDGDPANNERMNLLVLCAVHHRMAHEGMLNSNMCSAIKRLLVSENRFSDVGKRILRTRDDYLACAIDELDNTKRNFRCVYVGPLFLHPDWYFRRHQRQTGAPGLDRQVREFLRACDQDRRISTRIILRNTQRYVDKVFEIVRPSEVTRLKSEMLSLVDEIWGKSGRRGPLLCNVNTGFLRIPLIFDSSIVVTTRAAEGMPVEGGVIYRSDEDVKLERRTFDTVFDAASESMKTEVNRLREFIEKPWP